MVNGERKMETPALISAIVQDVQRAQIGGSEKQDNLDMPDCKRIEIIPVPQVQTTDDHNENNKDPEVDSVELAAKPETGGMKGTAGSQHSLELGMDLDKVEHFNSGNPPVMNLVQVASLESEFKKEQTPPTVPVSQESPSPAAHVPGVPLPVIRELSSPDSKPAKLDFSAIDASQEHIDDVEESRFASPWSPGVVEDQPIVYMPPPVVETECDEELEELANVGRTERQVVAIASSHHLSTMYDHHHHHDDLKKHVRDLPLDSEPVRHSSDDKKTHDEVSSHKLDHKSGGESPEPPPPGNLYRVPSILEQMVDEPPAEAGENRPLYRVPSVLEQMMDEPPVQAVDHEPNPPDIDEYRLDSAEFASDRQEGSSHSHHALHVPGSAVAVTTCRDLHFRDSEAGFILGDTEVAPAAEGDSSFSEASEGGKSNDEGQCEFPLDSEEPVEPGQNKSRSLQEDKERIDQKLVVSTTNGGYENKAASNEERISKASLEEKESDSEKINDPLLDEIPRVSDMFGNAESNVQFFIGDHHEDVNDYSEPLSTREEKLDNNFYSEGERRKLGEEGNKIGANFDTVEAELNAAPGKLPEKGLVSFLVDAEPRIPSFNELYNNEEEDQNFAEDAADEEADDYWARDEPGALSNGLDFGRLETDSNESHHRDELLRPKPPPGRSERGCSSAR